MGAELDTTNPGGFGGGSPAAAGSPANQGGKPPQPGRVDGVANLGLGPLKENDFFMGLAAPTRNALNQLGLVDRANAVQALQGLGNLQSIDLPDGRGGFVAPQGFFDPFGLSGPAVNLGTAGGLPAGLNPPGLGGPRVAPVDELLGLLGLSPGLGLNLF